MGFFREIIVTRRHAEFVAHVIHKRDVYGRPARVLAAALERVGDIAFIRHDLPHPGLDRERAVAIVDF